MKKVEVGKDITFELGGKELAKVLFFYGLIPDVTTSEYKIVCPFHEDMNPSLIVNLEKGNWYCFGCNKSGNAYDFVEGIETKRGIKGIKLLKRFFHILHSKKVERLNYNPKIKTKKESEELYNMAWDYYYGLRRVDWKTTDIEEAVEVKKYMLKRGFKASTLNKAQAKITYNKQYQLIFPMLDNGVFKGWVCRTNIPEVEQKRKYLYNGGFLRRNTLVGNYAGCNYVFVVEGFMDRLKFVQFGVDNVVAILGWKMSREQEKKLRDAKVEYIISALDNDTCGKKGTEYLKNIFPSKVIRFAYLKGIKDPGEMTKELFDKMYTKTMNKLKESRGN
jgi:DNA primase